MDEFVKTDVAIMKHTVVPSTGYRSMVERKVGGV